MSKFYNELKRRNVIKSTIAYLIVAWIVIQVALAVLPTFGAADWVIQAIFIVIAIGLPIWIIISWIYDLTPQGIEKTPQESEKQINKQIVNKRLNVFLIVSLSIAVVVLTLKLSNVFDSGSDNKYSIAVLYFDNMSVDEDNEWLGEGMTESITTHLKPSKNLIVIGRTSVKKYRESIKDIPEIAKELNVSYIVEGSVMKQGNNLKITAQLINAKNEHVWSDEYLVNFEDYLNVQTNIAKKIVQKLKINLSLNEEKLIAYNPTDSIEAFKLFQRGITLADDRTKKGLESSIEYYQRAIEIDSNYAEAYGEIANSYYVMGWYGRMNLEESTAKTNLFIEKALKINPNNVRALSVRAMRLKDEKKWVKAKEYLDKAIALNPNDATTHHYSFIYYGFKPVRDLIERLNHATIAAQLEPLSIPINANKIVALLENNKIQEANNHLDKISFIFLNINWASRYRSMILNKEIEIEVDKKKDRSVAIDIYQKAIEDYPDNSNLVRNLGIAYDFILNDGENYIKYTKKAYELDSIKSINIDNYYNALLEGKQFKNAELLMNSKNYNSGLGERSRLHDLWSYHYYKEDYKKAQEILKDPIFDTAYRFKLLNFAQLGDLKSINKILESTKIRYVNRAFVYAILKESDSMYHYLNKENIDYEWVNSRFEFDPYRKEERYKAFLRKHYLPITHWNE